MIGKLFQSVCLYIKERFNRPVFGGIDDDISRNKIGEIRINELQVLRRMTQASDEEFSALILRCYKQCSMLL